MDNIVKGWKCFDENMQCRGFQFEVGKTYEIEGKPKLCGNGFHFHENRSDLFLYYEDNFLKTVVCEVEAHEVVTGDDKSVCKIIKIIKKLSGEEVKSIYMSGFGDGYGSGFGDGSGSGFGDGSGSGYGSGSGFGDGSGSGYGSGYGFGYGEGYGYGDGEGYGYGDKYGSGSGSGSLKYKDYF